MKILAATAQHTKQHNITKQKPNHQSSKQLFTTKGKAHHTPPRIHPITLTAITIHTSTKTRTNS
jgi:hypothetical protein